MADEPETVGEAVAVDTAATVDNAIADANARAEVAEATAAAVAEGALEGERANRIEQLEREIFNCREANSREIADLRASLEAMLSETAQGMASANRDALAGLGTRLDQMEAAMPKPSIQDQSAEPPTTETVVTPTNDEGSNAATETHVTVSEKPARRHRFL